MEEEETKATELLKGKIVKEVKRYNEGEIIIKFEEGIEILVFGYPGGTDFSIADSTIEEDE
ncbi:MAG: hypothetical protein ACR2F2_09385 [Pyrinomonadaceae bacterium]